MRGSISIATACASSAFPEQASPAYLLEWAAKALADGKLDGFWANAMGAENAVRAGVGKVILDVRRGLGPKAAFHYTLPALVTSDHVVRREFRLAEGDAYNPLMVDKAKKRLQNIGFFKTVEIKRRPGSAPVLP